MKTGTPEQVERDQNWLAGIRLQGVDNLRVSNYLLELSVYYETIDQYMEKEKE